jgi:ABC-2 type transport system permease protein
MFNKIISDFKKNEFLFSELVKRDFKKKYKRTYLGMLWSVLSPLLTLLVMSLVFTNFFGRTTPHYTIYLFCGNIVFSFFSDATNGGMGSLMSNSAIFTKINVPKYLFLLR